MTEYTFLHHEAAGCLLVLALSKILSDETNSLEVRGGILLSDRKCVAYGDLA